jgi:hypothetical protein
MLSADTAVVVSVISVGIAAAALGWNIYRDVLHKPRVRLSIGKRLLVGNGEPLSVIGLSAVNHGPGPIQLRSAIIRRRYFLPWKRKHNMDGVVMHQPVVLGSEELPKILDVGDTLTLLWPWTSEGFIQAQPTGFALVDTFGRCHWVSGKNVQHMNANWVADFPDANRFRDTDAPAKFEESIAP